MAKKKQAMRVEVKGLGVLAGAMALLLCLVSFSKEAPDANWLGLMGHSIAWIQQYLFGLTSYLIIPFVGWIGWKLLCGEKIEDFVSKLCYFSLFWISTALLLNLIGEHLSYIPPFFHDKIYIESTFFELPYPHRAVRYNLGGVPLYYLYRDLPTFNLQRLLSDVGIGLTFSITALVSLLLFSQVEFLDVWEKMKALGESLKNLMKRDASIEKGPLIPLQKKSAAQIEETLTKHMPEPIYPPQKGQEMRIHTHNEAEARKEESKAKTPSSKREKALQAQAVYNGDFTSYELPPPSLLSVPKKIDQPTLKKDLRRQAEILEETLMSFGIEAKVGDIHSGPTITSFEVHPAIGVKVQKITALENDIALNLQAKSIRIIAPIPGKAAVGVEIPSLYPQEVSFKEMLVSYLQNPRKFMIPVLLGKTVSGDNVMSDLAKMPHCIIAGATGSGKSVCINTLILSILMTARPDEIKLLMIDPKKVELAPYTELPHLIAPVITEPHGAYAALNWLVKEMQTRYEILKQLGLRNISGFNTRKVNKELEESMNITVPEKMPAIVAIIDEFADLMMASSSDLETPIARIAQMARAVGIHLVLATQRPSREVITGLIKANFPTRIAFKVASRINSQIILDDTGAETLLGNGDMLFLPPGSSHLIRAQGAYVSDEEMNRIISFITNQAPPKYLIESFDSLSKESFAELESQDEGSSSRDSLYEQARQIVLDTNNASTTFLQRKLKIGYARAASLMDELESKGVIGPQEGSRPRRVLSKNSSLTDKRQTPEDDEQESFEL